MTTDGDGDVAIGETSSSEVTNGEGQGNAARHAINQMLEFSGKEAGCDRVREVGLVGGAMFRRPMMFMTVSMESGVWMMKTGLPQGWSASCRSGMLPPGVI